ncbi:hypothetical protein HK405_011320, partial [Cladochytrium tenue]
MTQVIAALAEQSQSIRALQKAVADIVRAQDADVNGSGGSPIRPPTGYTPLQQSPSAMGAYAGLDSRFAAADARVEELCSEFAGFRAGANARLDALSVAREQDVKAAADRAEADGKAHAELVARLAGLDDFVRSLASRVEDITGKMRSDVARLGDAIDAEAAGGKGVIRLETVVASGQEVASISATQAHIHRDVKELHINCNARRDETASLRRDLEELRVAQDRQLLAQKTAAERIELHDASLDALHAQLRPALRLIERDADAAAGVKEARAHFASLHAEVRKVRERTASKVDTRVLERLVQHLATRDEVRRLVDGLREHNAALSRRLASVAPHAGAPVVAPAAELANFDHSQLGEMEGRVAELEARVEELSQQQHKQREQVKDLGQKHSGPRQRGRSEPPNSRLQGFEDGGCCCPSDNAQRRTGRKSDPAHPVDDADDDLPPEMAPQRAQWWNSSDSLSGLSSLCSDAWAATDRRRRSPAGSEASLAAAGGLVGASSRAHGGSEPRWARAVRALARETDEKLFRLCGELGACRAALEASARRPFLRCGVWEWRSGVASSATARSPAVQWDLEAANTDPDNFGWERGRAHVRVREPGLYEVAFAFFSASGRRPSVQLVVNGESVLSAINSPSFVVHHHASGLVPNGDGRLVTGAVTGLSLL